jgi:hypothetical protein
MTEQCYLIANKIFIRGISLIFKQILKNVKKEIRQL